MEKMTQLTNGVLSGRCREANASQNPQHSKLSFLVVIAMTLGLASSVRAAQAVDHSGWDILLHRYVKEGRVDYEGLKAQQAQLEHYLEKTLRDIIPEYFDSTEQMAIWINVYNACVVKGVLDHYPIKSVKEVKGFFDKIRYHIAGRELTLNEIEAEARAVIQIKEEGRPLRGDWRIHFALVCASSSCPSLRSEAYGPTRVDEQLTDQVKQFLADSARGLRVDASTRTLWVSKIFKWYAKDFVPNGSLDVETLIAVIAPYLEPVVVQSIRQQKLKLKFLDYDWTLNAQHR